MERTWLRPLTTADFPLMVRWLSMLHVLEWWGPAPTAAEVESKYTPRVTGQERVQCLAACAGDKPIGMIQWHRTGDVPYDYAALRLPPDAVGIDMFIGEPDYVGRGFGQKILLDLFDQLADERISMFVIDPSPSNLRAIHAYQRVGFRPAVRLASDDGEHVVMIRKASRGTKGVLGEAYLRPEKD